MTKRQILEELKRGELIAAVERFELPVADRRVRSLLGEALASSRKAPIAEIRAAGIVPTRSCVVLRRTLAAARPRSSPIQRARATHE